MMQTYAQQQQEADDACSERFNEATAGQAWVFEGFNIWRSKGFIHPYNLAVGGNFVGSFRTLESAKRRGEVLTK